MSTGNNQQVECQSGSLGSEVTFDGIREPGCYVCDQTGQMLRVPEDSLGPGRSPSMCIEGTERMMLTKISEDPFVRVSKARMLAANRDLTVDF